MCLVQTPSCKKKDKTLLLITELPPNWRPTRIKHDSEIVPKDSANFGNVHCNVRIGPDGEGEQLLMKLV
jgi:hypothetical protein